jgi:hypothetical protein
MPNSVIAIGFMKTVALLWPSPQSHDTIAAHTMKGFYRVITPQLSPAQRRHLERYAQVEVEGFKNTKSEHRLLALGLIERCDERVRYTETVTWTIYKARITPAGRQFLAVA